MRSNWHIWILMTAFLLQGTGPMTLVISFLLQRERITREFCVNVDRPELACKGKCYLASQFESEEETPDRPMTMHPLQVLQLDLPPGHIYMPTCTSPRHVAPMVLHLFDYGSTWRQDIYAPPWHVPLTHS